VIGAIEKRIKMQHRSNEASQRLKTIPGIGVIGATAIAATDGERRRFAMSVPVPLRGDFGAAQLRGGTITF
jgi:transposase